MTRGFCTSNATRSSCSTIIRANSRPSRHIQTQVAARGEPCRFAQSDAAKHGHPIEVAVCLEQVCGGVMCRGLT
jgi:hypothetical protein